MPTSVQGTSDDVIYVNGVAQPSGHSDVGGLYSGFSGLGSGNGVDVGGGDPGDVSNASEGTGGERDIIVIVADNLSKGVGALLVPPIWSQSDRSRLEFIQSSLQAIVLNDAIATQEQFKDALKEVVAFALSELSGKALGALLGVFSSTFTANPGVGFAVALISGLAVDHLTGDHIDALASLFVDVVWDAAAGLSTLATSVQDLANYLQENGYSIEAVLGDQYSEFESWLVENYGTDASNYAGHDPQLWQYFVQWLRGQFGLPPTPDFQPIVIDLDGDGVELISLSESRTFVDFDDDGFLERTGWVGADDGILVLDQNQNGTVDSAFEYAFALHSPDAATDLEGLQIYDTNNDGVLDASDELWSSFLVWNDANSNGISDEGELYSLDELGISAIDLGINGGGYSHDGNQVHNVGRVNWVNGTTGTFGDVSFLTESDGVQVEVRPNGTLSIVREDGVVEYHGTAGGNDVLEGTDSPSVFVSIGGQDQAIGGGGSDSYNLLTNDGELTITDSGGDDILNFGLYASAQDLWFARDGNDLTVSNWVAGGSVRITDYFGDGAIETIIAGGEAITPDDVEILVQAMAEFDLDADGLPDEEFSNPQSGPSALHSLSSDIQQAWREVAFG